MKKFLIGIILIMTIFIAGCSIVEINDTLDDALGQTVEDVEKNTKDVVKQIKKQGD